MPPHDEIIDQLDDNGTYNTDDFAACRLFSFDELAQLCAENKEVTHNMPIEFKKFYQCTK